MKWIKNYQLFLFDFDGLLVNTEEIHFQAYQLMCEKFGFKLDWSFDRYCLAAHYQVDGIQEQVYEALPQLKKEQPNWDVLYAYKRKKVLELLEQGSAQLMPGVEKLLYALENESIKRCVVTHSPLALVNTLRKQHPVLNTIPYWITREDYAQPKPHPEGYQTAIKKYASAQDKIIGFEDTLKGIEALLHTEAKPVLIASSVHGFIPERVERYSSFEELS